jgi:Zn-finger nucleic acid-binding protein
MTWARVGEADLLECGTCDGTWVEAVTFERICADRESQAALLHAPHEAPRTAGAAPPFRYRPCLKCGKLMNRVNFGRLSGAIVDVCRGHDTFLDRGELHQIVRFIQEGGIDRARTAEREGLAGDRRRLLDLERMRIRQEASSGSGALHSPLRDLLSALLGS